MYAVLTVLVNNVFEITENICIITLVSFIISDNFHHIHTALHAMFIRTKYSMVFFSFTEGNFAIIQSIKSFKVKILNSLRRTHIHIKTTVHWNQCTGMGSLI